MKKKKLILTQNIKNYIKCNLLLTVQKDAPSAVGCASSLGRESGVGGPALFYYTVIMIVSIINSSSPFPWWSGSG